MKKQKKCTKYRYKKNKEGYKRQYFKCNLGIIGVQKNEPKEECARV